MKEKIKENLSEFLGSIVFMAVLVALGYGVYYFLGSNHHEIIAKMPKAKIMAIDTLKTDNMGALYILKLSNGKKCYLTPAQGIRVKEQDSIAYKIVAGSDKISECEVIK